ncbi:F0F1 ATP synthase subunit B [Auraticoccus sp. F435]|uniref:ATP synthase subunit b n=1 Tax=Auraticoccus cholistanensis TaxID=2656650 RepID=A0A6A9UXL7_9ACTN|nr:F0F1 ATP synthase subunit B [Auraticoccus cholistanensis]MVA76047.1 F0F1 ATP synthase subunit B [Auraticoccus cholistanensis]
MPVLEVNLGPLLPHYLSEVIMGALLMVVIYVVMRAKVVPAFEKMYEERRAAIEGGMEKAEAAQREAEEALAQYRAQLADARTEAARIREDAKNQGAQILAEMREEAQAESERIRSQARAAIEAERSQVVAQLRAEVGGLATTLAGRIVGESLQDDERARRTVERFLADLESQPAQGDGVAQRSGSTAL